MSACSILLVSANRHTLPYPVYPLGLSYLKTYLERTISGIRVDMADCNLLTDGQLAERIRMLAPRYIGLSLRNVDGANSLDRGVSCPSTGRWRTSYARQATPP